MGKPLAATGDEFRVLIGSDLHGHLLSKPAFRCFLGAASIKKWDLCILNGDVLNFDQLSKHDKHVGTFRREFVDEVGMVEEIAFTQREIFHPLREALGDSRIVMRLGNHETRWLKVATSNPTAMAEMLKTMRRTNSTHLEDVLNLDKWGIKLSYNGIDRLFSKFTIIHGVKTSPGAAKQNLQRYGSGTSGHSHRMLCHTGVMHGTLEGWWESGCLCKTDADYRPHGDLNDWAPGFLTLTINRKTGRFFCNPHFVINGQCEVDGQLIG